jgi:hypothetical protein
MSDPEFDCAKYPGYGKPLSFVFGSILKLVKKAAKPRRPKARNPVRSIIICKSISLFATEEHANVSGAKRHGVLIHVERQEFDSREARTCTPTLHFDRFGTTVESRPPLTKNEALQALDRLHEQPIKERTADTATLDKVS